MEPPTCAVDPASRTDGFKRVISLPHQDHPLGTFATAAQWVVTWIITWFKEYMGLANTAGDKL
jgi:hypothetical protein